MSVATPKPKTIASITWNLPHGYGKGAWACKQAGLRFKKIRLPVLFIISRDVIEAGCDTLIDGFVEKGFDASHIRDLRGIVRIAVA